MSPISPLDRIEDILTRLKLAANIATDTALAKRMEIPLRRLQTWKQRNTIPYKEIIGFCLINGIDLNHILAGRETAGLQRSLKTSNSGTCSQSDYVCPPAGTIEALDLRSAQIVNTIQIHREWVQFVLNIALENVCIIRIVGNNMSPWVSDGDMVLIDTSFTTIVADAPYILEFDSILVAKRLVRQNDGTVIAKSDNPHCEDEVFPPDTKVPQIVGRIVRRLVH